MRVLVAPDCFSGTLTAVQATDAICDGWLRHDPAAVLDPAPMSDGGPGFLEVLHASLGGSLHTYTVPGPVGDPVPAQVLLAGDRTVYVEAAQACGTHLLPGGVARPLEAGTAGVGALLAAVLSGLDPAAIVVGVGGTASTDGGRGCVELLGGGGLGGTELGVPLVIATDVDNPLLGRNGAAAVFGPQKGAAPGDVTLLEDRLQAWVRHCDGSRARADPAAAGAGAGGGLGYGLMLLGGRRASGVQTVLEAVDLPARAARADLLLTGEGCFDGTSLRGKVPKGVAWVAQRAGRPCVVLAGRVMVGRREFSAAGIDAAYALEESAGSLAAAMADPGPRLADLAARVARSWTPRG